MKLSIVVRTCSKRSVTTGLERIVDCTREEMILKCIDSLIVSANNCDREISIKILDDHSDIEFLNKLQTIVLHKSRHPVELRNLEIEGFNYSLHEQFKEALSTDDLIYFVEDDYFHCDDAIESMISFYESDITDSYKKFNFMAIYPYDCPHRYWPQLIDPTLMFYHSNRYWRTITHTAGTVMLHSNVVKNFWNIFEALAVNYPNVKESNSINLLYSNLVQHGGPVACFSPIPSVAQHISYQNEAPNILTTKFTNWEQDWNNYGKT